MNTLTNPQITVSLYIFTASLILTLIYFVLRTHSLSSDLTSLKQSFNMHQQWAHERVSSISSTIDAKFYEHAKSVASAVNTCTRLLLSTGVIKTYPSNLPTLNLPNHSNLLFCPKHSYISTPIKPDASVLSCTGYASVFSYQNRTILHFPNVSAKVDLVEFFMALRAIHNGTATGSIIPVQELPPYTSTCGGRYLRLVEAPQRLFETVCNSENEKVWKKFARKPDDMPLIVAL